MKKLLWIGDAAVSSGFARCTHHTLKGFLDSWDVAVLGLNYKGDPHKYPYPIYPCWPGGDAFGIGRVEEMMLKLDPDVVVIQNDPWNMEAYLDVLNKCKGRKVPVIGALAVDGKNCATGDQLNRLTGAIFWTSFGLEEARKGGFTGPAAVVPLGVDLDIYQPTEQSEARRLIGLPEVTWDKFIVGNVNRNQPRKRLDLTVKYFAEWVKSYDQLFNAYLFLHVAPTGDQGYNVGQLLKYYGLRDRLILSKPDIGHGIHERNLAALYSSFDVQMTTTQGEGWGLCTMEGMACGVPQIVPRWSALGEWARSAARFVECTSTCVTPNYVNVIGGVPDQSGTIEALDELYKSRELMEELTDRGTELVGQDRFRWPNIATAFREAVEGFLREK